MVGGEVLAHEVVEPGRADLARRSAATSASVSWSRARAVFRKTTPSRMAGELRRRRSSRSSRR